ncbi:MAG: hypothetical protein CM15mP125_0560 [Gammaproteobacteria bacterium]|nr:MAG: hypothetical protein CM15mP125_0560 [Gammaproteobacteria bacterium]
MANTSYAESVLEYYDRLFAPNISDFYFTEQEIREINARP